MMRCQNIWYLLYTRPNNERKVALQLSARGICYFLPEKNTLRQWHDRKKIVRAPMFPSYIFINVIKRDDYISTLECNGSLHFVRIGQELVTVKEDTILTLKRLIEDGTNLEICHKYFQPGEELYIRTGTFSGHNCEVVKYRNKNVIIVRLNIMCGNVLVDLPVEVLENTSLNYC